MKYYKKKSYLVALLLVVVLLLASCGNAGGGNAGTVDSSGGGADVGTDFDGNRTLLIYMVGSDLEPSTAAASNDLTEIEESGVNLDKVNVLVFTGGAPTWHSEIPTDKNALLELTSEGFKVKETFDVKSMGDAENLARFLNHAHENYSSGEYDLILWDHGCGPIMGYGIDKQFENDTLTLPELKEGLSNSPFGKDKKLGFIGCDACLMASAELASVVSDYADILVSSQEAEPSFGWNYAFMSEADSLNALDFSKSIVDKYMEYSEEFFANNKFFQSDVTLSVVNLNEAKNIEDAINTLFAEAIDDVSGAYNKLAVSRVESRDLGRASTGSDYDLVDLQSLLDCMSARYPKETEAALDALNKAVLYNKTNTPECSGLSLYYPFYNKIYFENSWEQGYEDLGVFGDYFTYMQRFSKVWLGTDGKEIFNTSLIAEQGTEEFTYTMKLTPEQVESYAGAGFFILRKREEGELFEAVIYSDDVELNDDVLIARFNGKVIYIDDGSGEYYIPPTTYKGKAGDEQQYVINNSSIRKDDYDYTQVEFHMSVDPIKDELKLKGMFTMSEPFGVVSGSEEIDDPLFTGKKEPLDISEWQELMILNTNLRYLTRDESGAILDFWDWKRQGGATGVELRCDSIDFKYEPIYADGSEYFIMFAVQDTQGNKWCSELLPIALQKQEKLNDDVQTIEWDGKSEIILYENENHSLAMSLVDTDDGRAFQAKAVNKEQEDYTYRVYDYVLNNDTAYCSTDFHNVATYVLADAATEKTKELKELNDLIRYSDCTTIEEIEFSVDFSEAYSLTQDTRKYRLIINQGEGLEVENKGQEYEPFRGFTTDHVAFWNEDGLECELVELVGKEDGISSTSKNQNHSMVVAFSLKNSSDETKYFRFGGVTVNGLYLPVSKVSLQDKMAIPPGKEYFYTSELHYFDFNYLNIEEVKSLEIETYASNGNYEKKIWTTLKDDPTEEEFILGDVFFDQGGIKMGVVDYGIETTYDSEERIWKVAIENTLDEGVLIDDDVDKKVVIVDGEEIGYNGIDNTGASIECRKPISAGQRTYFDITLYDHDGKSVELKDGSTVQFYIRVLSRDGTSVLVVPEEPITLVAK